MYVREHLRDMELTTWMVVAGKGVDDFGPDNIVAKEVGALREVRECLWEREGGKTGNNGEVSAVC